ncbi:unnamed protein product [Calypogeia fissa]
MGQKSRAVVNGGSPGSQKSRALVNGASPGLLEKRKKDKSVLVLDGLVSDLARRTQSAIDGNGPTQHLESIRAIHRLLGQIQKLERPFVIQPNAADISGRLNALEEWLQLQGVPMVGLKLTGGLKEGAGVVAQRKFDKGQMLCTVPAHVMMTTATAIRSKDDVGILFKADPILRQMPTLILALHLLFEKHRPSEEPSNWAGYIQSLPGQGSSSESNSENTDNFIMPLAFSLETIEALKGTAVLVEMHKALRNYARQYAHVRLLLKQLRGQSMAIELANAWFTWAEFRWAASIVMTRQNPIPGTPDMETPQALALIPYLDMFNHEEGDITCHFAVQHQQMELTAKRDFEAGEQVYISYGYRPNSALLLYSGFVPEHNSRDRIKVPVELSQSDPLYAKKAALLKWLELPSSGWLELFYDGTPSPELATWVKVAIMQDLSVVTENLRAAIASRAQETAAILQYKAALREAEEKARSLGLQQNEEAAQTSSEIEDNLVIKESPEVDQEDGSPEAERDHTITEDSIRNVEDSPATDSLEEKASEGTEEEPVAVKEPAEAGVLEESETGSGPPALTERSHLPTGEAEFQEVEPSHPVEGGENGLDEHQQASDSQEHEYILGEHLFPAEAALLGEMCKLRISELGNGGVQNNGLSLDLPKGLGAGLGGGLKVQPKSQSKELAMALKIRQQEQDTLLRAIDRGSRFQHNHSNCQHCH